MTVEMAKEKCSTLMEPSTMVPGGTTPVTEKEFLNGPRALDGLKEIFKSKKFWGALVGAIVVFFEASYFEGHPQMLEILVTTASFFGIQIVGQAHADANDEGYKSKKK